ncbi:MAG: hypothetical protein RR573_01595 [Oscillospiraceae bacterium]
MNVKRNLTLFVVCALSLAMSSCTANKNKLSAQTSSSVNSSSAISSSSATVSSSEPLFLQELTVLGIIKESTDSLLTVSCSLGTLTFDVKNADKTGTKNIAVGTEITIYYKGEIKGNDTSAVNVIKLTQSSNADVEQCIKGTIDTVTNDAITVKADVGKLVFDISKADKSKAKSLKSGEKIEVYFLGTVIGTDTTRATVQRLVQSVPIINGEMTAVGTITDVTMNSIDVKTQNGVMNFITSTANLSEAGNLAIGSTITVYYKEGNVEGRGNSIIANRITQSADKPNNMVGTVTQSSANDVTIINNKGETYTFIIADAKKDGVSLKKDDKIKIEYRGDIAGNDGATVQVISISQA